MQAALPHPTAFATLARDPSRAGAPRAVRGVLPVFGALVIDLFDLVALTGPPGIAAGLVFGSLLTWAVAYHHGLRFWPSLLAGLAGGIYCALPLTELLPLATLLAVISRNVLLYGRRSPATEGRLAGVSAFAQSRGASAIELPNAAQPRRG